MSPRQIISGFGEKELKISADTSQFMDGQRFFHPFGHNLPGSVGPTDVATFGQCAFRNKYLAAHRIGFNTGREVDGAGPQLAMMVVRAQAFHYNR